MQCTYGGEVTFAACEPGYRLRVANGSTLSILLDTEDVQRLQARMQAVVAEVQEERTVTHPLPGKRLLLFDVDGTLRRTTVPGQPCPNGPDEWELLPNVRETLACYDWDTQHDWRLISNQGGIGLGYMTESACLRLLYSCVHACGLPTTYSFVAHLHICPHAPNAGCVCRKPSPWMLLQAIQDVGVQLDEALYIGDMDSDREAARRAGIDYIEAARFFGWVSQP
jgi:D-glycero-D-manno-heptose 1,7-bisphosphate phosphatase